MNEEQTHVGVEGICLEVFGMLSASVTHEIKNTLSIINENAGLLQDLCGMVDEDTGIPAKRVEATTATIVNQVSRSNNIMKNLNRFAHSNDKVPGQTDLSEMLQLMADLTSRFADMRKISVKVSCQTGKILEANLFVLHSLVFLTLKRLYSACPEGSVLLVLGEADEEERLVVRFLLEGELSLSCPPDFPGPKEDALAEEIKATCIIQDGEVVIKLA